MAKKKSRFRTTKDILKEIAGSFEVDDSDSVVDWVIKNRIRNEDGQLLKYDDRKFLIDFMNDLTPKQAILASAQVG